MLYICLRVSYPGLDLSIFTEDVQLLVSRLPPDGLQPMLAPAEGPTQLMSSQKPSNSGALERTCEIILISLSAEMRCRASLILDATSQSPGVLR